MTQEDRELLRKDLSSRITYGVKVSLIYKDKHLIGTLDAVYANNQWDGGGLIIDNLNYPIAYYDVRQGRFHIEENEIKPYLFPLSSMTNEQKKEQEAYLLCIYKGDTNRFISQYIDWLNKNMFDWRGLISKGLAIDATGLNIY